MLLVTMLTVASFALQAAELNTKLPATEQQNGSLAPVNVDMPSQPLDVSLKQLARTTGMSVAFDSNLASGKTAPAIKGRMKADEALKMLLAGTGLESTIDKDNAVIKPVAQKPDVDMKLESIEVRSKRFYEIGPLPGLGLTKEQIPGNVQTITAKEIKEANSLSLTDLLNRKLQSVNINDYQGNPFQMDVTYRGFTAGPQIGTPQGLSVFFDGIRVNEPFGDVVNWDMIPMNALAGVDVFPGSNPIFGLNTLGGAFTVKTKDGFNHTGIDANVLTGSFNRKQLQATAGWNNGTIALFGAGNFFLEDGWRENSPSRVNQAFGKASYRGEKLDLNLSTLLVHNNLVGNGLYPTDMYKQDSNGVFTSPDTTKNDLVQFQLSSSYFVSENFTVTAQVYRRDSKRHQIGADVFTGLANQEEGVFARDKTLEAMPYTCLLDSTNTVGLPDFYVLTIENPTDPFNDLFMDSFFNSGITDPDSTQLPSFLNLEKNKEDIPADVLLVMQQQFKLMSNLNSDYYKQISGATAPTIGEETSYSLGESSYKIDPSLFSSLGVPNSQINTFAGLDSFYYTNENGVVKKHFIMPISPRNNDECKTTQALDAVQDSTQRPYTYIDPQTGAIATVDGAYTGGRGIVEGTPTAIITDNKINQLVEGASIQFNWNYEHHKFMIGASIDDASAKYTNSQRLGLLDTDRNAYLAPDEIHPQFSGADISLGNNNFKGTNTTKSIYFSETWSPVKSWNFSLAARYNETQTKNKIATRYGANNFEIGELLSLPDTLALCPNKDCSNVPTGYKLPDLSNVLDEAETEKFSYYSFNPSLGATWQATDNLNIFANFAQGTRTPSVIELGCALDRTPGGTGTGIDENGNQYTYIIPKSVAEKRECYLPTTLSGDPYLPQIKATTFDIGARGRLGENFEWNIGAYQTNLKDDIYFVSVQDGRGFFDSIGNTRRRGIETGISGKLGKTNFSLNYSLTDATFQDEFDMFSADNSSARFINGMGSGIIRVKPGSRMPGVPLHNLNASVRYEITDKWQIGLSAVLHSESYLRGNENNEHEAGVARTFQSIRYVNGVAEPYTRTLPPTTNPGKVPGYAVFNLQSSYKFSSEWTATLLITNLFDTEYFSAGRLGRNPFSPSILGAIGPSGYNHNSDDWRSTNFIAPGAPRGIWFSLNYQFDPRK
ncbi:TonB-dependent receptor [Methylobacillus caricis]|uniref:TonB-dependent receptor domain-containing protein n=1 Tax=Methylobacillus caricis TaxID=1971611 RepID=UPI001CFFC19D|nr:TonB-dependent receptor [Methylobacillus caricis]MCB5187935.1 TonB-dependent receptor [Methylobacillus caricis]